jgi:hypothetical protein
LVNCEQKEKGFPTTLHSYAIPRQEQMSVACRVFNIYEAKVTGKEHLLQFVSGNSTTVIASSETVLQLLYDL